MLFRARYSEPGIRNGVDLEPGQLLLGLGEISEKAGISRETTRRILKKLEVLEVITKQTTPQGQIISFCRISNYIMTRAETDNEATAMYPPKPQVTVEAEETLETKETIAPSPPLTNDVVGDDLKKDKRTSSSMTKTRTALTNNRSCQVPTSTAEWRDLISTERMRSEEHRERFDAAKKLALLVDQPEIFKEIVGEPLLEPEPDFCERDLYDQWMNCTTARTVPDVKPMEIACIFRLIHQHPAWNQNYRWTQEKLVRVIEKATKRSASGIPMLTNPLRLIMITQHGAGDRLTFESIADHNQGATAWRPGQHHTLATRPPHTQSVQIHPDSEATSATTPPKTNG